MDVKIIHTADGSHSLLNTALNELYHSRHGAIQESNHVFIQSGLEYFLQKSPGSGVRILEVGFGTGLNALLTLQVAIESGVKVHYTTVEAYPLGEEIVAELNYPTLIAFPGAPEYFRSIHSSLWHATTILANTFTIEKFHLKIEEMMHHGPAYDIIYFDAFAPGKQPEIWDLSILAKIGEAMAARGIFVTYSAKGQLKRDLRSLGFEVQTLPGPPGKKEMVRAIKS